MFPLVEYPDLVQHYAPQFKDVFSAEAFVEFKRYISGLIVSENKTVDGINRLFVTENRNQSSLNRLLTESPFSLETLNEARLRLLASLRGTQLKARGVLSLDDTLLTHYGEEFEQIVKLYDHTSASYVWSHNPTFFISGEPFGPQRHVALVAVVCNLLRAAQHDPGLHEQLQRQLKVHLEGNPASWRRAAQAQSLWCLALFISAGLA